MDGPELQLEFLRCSDRRVRTIEWPVCKRVVRRDEAHQHQETYGGVHCLRRTASVSYARKRMSACTSGRGQHLVHREHAIEMARADALLFGHELLANHRDLATGPPHARNPDLRN